MNNLIKLQNSSYHFALLIFILLHTGLIAELVLIEHYQSLWQFLPIATLVLGLLSLRMPVKSLFLVKIFYLLTIVCGALGIILHLKNNWEFELEMYPGMRLGELMAKSLAGALPALAPGTLIPIGLMGFLLLQLKIKEDSQ